MATIHHQPAIDFPCDQGQFSQRYGDTMGIISWEYNTTKVTVTKTTVVTVYDLGLLATEELIRFRGWFTIMGMMTIVTLHMVIACHSYPGYPNRMISISYLEDLVENDIGAKKTLM